MFVCVVSVVSVGYSFAILVHKYCSTSLSRFLSSVGRARDF